LVFFGFLFWLVLGLVYRVKIVLQKVNMSEANTTYINHHHHTCNTGHTPNNSKMSTSEVLNSLVSEKQLGKYNLLRVLLPSTALGASSAANLIPAVKSWLGANQVELTITLDDLQIDMTTNIYQHYSKRVMNMRPVGSQDDLVDILKPLTGKLALFNVTQDDTNIPRYAAHTLRKYESVITGVSIDDRNNILIPIRHTPVLHIHMPDKGRILNEKYLEYRFRLLEFGKTPAYIFIKQMQMQTSSMSSGNTNIVIGIEFMVDEKEFVSDARLAMIIKYISGLQILLGSI